MSKAPQGVIELRDCCVDVMEGEHKEGVKFLILKDSRCYEIAASTEKERDDWMSAINSCIENRYIICSFKYLSNLPCPPPPNPKQSG